MIARLAEKASRGARKATIAVDRARRWRRVPAGFLMNIDPTDFHDRGFYLGTYEPEVTALIRGVVQPGDTCIDVGAQKGYFTLQLAQYAGASGRVHAFEPDPRALEALTESLANNRCNCVTVHPFLLADADGKRVFTLSAVTGWSSCFPNEIAQREAERTVIIEARAFDSLEVDIYRLSFIKIDAEGAEPLVLAGMRRTLKDSNPCICMEINPDSLRKGGFSIADVTQPLLALGYKFYEMHCDRQSPLLFRITPITDIASWSSEINRTYFNVAAMRHDRFDGLTTSRD